MSPRKNYPKNKRPKRQNLEITASNQRFEEHSEGLYTVRNLTGSGATKPYRCPGCDHMIPLATPHIVAWLEDDEEGRRHWHSTCWAKKDKRRPNTERTRNAPKY